MNPGNPEGGGSRIPVVRHFIACERLNKSLDGQNYSLINLLHTIRCPSGTTFPYSYPEIWLYAQLTDGRGEHSFRVQLFLLAEEETDTGTSRPIQRDLGQDPLLLHYLTMKVRNVTFEFPGLYEFRLLCDGVEIAREPLLLEEES